MAHCVENIYCIADEEDIRDQMKNRHRTDIEKKKTHGLNLRTLVRAYTGFLYR